MKTSFSNSPFRSTSFRWEDEETSAESPLSFSLLPDGKNLMFEAQVKVPPRREIAGFRSELWLDDVAELFLVPDQASDPDRYIEFNFASGGAWWAASFPEPRKQERELPNAVEILESVIETNRWRVRARLLGFGGENGGELIGNVCGIFGQNPRRYASLHPLSNDIDFHCPKYFGRMGC